ncbi:hypothetical protein H311_01250, partial [Anncaliia algerae PRA109]
MLKREVTCGYCSELMTEKILRNHVDGISWVCSNNSCNKRRTTCSIRKDSFFSFFRLSLADIWTLVIMWCEDIQIIEVQRRYGINRKTIGLVYNKLRELASNYFDLDPIRLGGPGIICQVDESLFCHKQKFGKGRTPERERWVFGISDTSTKPAKFYMEPVVNRSAETLLPIIQRVCRPGTI